MTNKSTLHTPAVQSTLHRLQRAAARDWQVLPRLFPRILAALLRKQTWESAFDSEAMRECYIPIAPQLGNFLYLTARQIHAKHIAEFGTSFGISTIYLAAALRDNGGGKVFGSEIIPEKRQQALRNLAESGLDDLVEIYPGDARQSFANLPVPLDLVLLDADKDLYLTMLHLLTPKLRRGAIIVADNIFTFRKSLQNYVDYVQNPHNGFVSMTLPLGDGCEISCFLPSEGGA